MNSPQHPNESQVDEIFLKHLGYTKADNGTYWDDDWTFDVSEEVANAKQAIEKLLLQERIEGMEQAKSRVLRRTEIPKNAKNPTRDATVYLGEAIADIIDDDIKQLEATKEVL